MYGIVVYLPRGLNIIPYCCDGLCGPRLAGVFMCPYRCLAQVNILEDIPFFCPIALEEFVPSNSSLGYDGTATLARIIVECDCVALEPRCSGFKYDCHEFEVGVRVFKVRSQFA
jgi:hypothetical protein